MQLSEGSLGVLLIGGIHSNSVEVIGFDNCSVPNLPEERHGHGSFLTVWGSLALSGGRWAGKPLSSDCLVLNTTSKQWERGILGNLVDNIVLGVIPMDVGTYMVHLTTSSFLPSGEREWIAGPEPQEKVQCAVGISALGCTKISKGCQNLIVSQYTFGLYICNPFLQQQQKKIFVNFPGLATNF